MSESLPADLFEQLEQLGQALDIGRPVSVFDGGRVGFNEEDESGVIKDVERQAERRSPARSRPGQRASRWSRRRSSAEAYHFRSGALEEAYGAGFRILAQHYATLGFEDTQGLWVAVKSHPLGDRGPQVHFLIGLPLDPAIAPRAWAFNRIGSGASPAGLRHTNFPDASICAFTVADNAWHRDEGILPLVDHYSVWTIKKWHYEAFGWWPGSQAGACSYYRRLESVGREWCGCQSGKRYHECHQPSDRLVDESFSRAEFLRIFKCDYDARSVPVCIQDAACNHWKNLPSLALAFSFRKADEPFISWG